MIAAVIALTRVGSAAAQDQPPSPEMLLNLDLFRSRPHDPQSDQPGEESDTGSESLFDQIRALNSIGMLGGNENNAPANYPVAPYAPAPPPPPPAPYEGQQSDFGGLPE